MVRSKTKVLYNHVCGLDIRDSTKFDFEEEFVRIMMLSPQPVRKARGKFIF